MRSTLWRAPRAKNATFRLSGDQNGSVASSVPPSGLASAASSGRSHNRATPSGPLPGTRDGGHQVQAPIAVSERMPPDSGTLHPAADRQRTPQRLLAAVPEIGRRATERDTQNGQKDRRQAPCCILPPGPAWRLACRPAALRHLPQSSGALRQHPRRFASARQGPSPDIVRLRDPAREVSAARESRPAAEHP